MLLRRLSPARALLALILVSLPFLEGAGVDAAVRTREYWIVAEPVEWTIVPTGRDRVTGEQHDAAASTFTALVYRLYSPNWGKPIGEPSMPGPTIDVRVGDRVVVHFLNRDTYYGRPHSIHPHGLHYTVANDGAYSHDAAPEGGGKVAVGESFTYTWTAAADSVGTWPYHDHSVDAEDNVKKGLFGAIIVRSGKEKPVKRTFVLAFHTFDRATTGLREHYEVVNGRAYAGNTPTLRARVGERVRFHVLALGDAFHTFHLHGHRWTMNDSKQAVDTFTVGPAESFQFEFQENEPGTWLYHCHVSSHAMMGMMGEYRVTR